MLSLATIKGFGDELEKLNASRSRMTVSQTRKGRRPMRVDTMLKKEKEGTLYKYTKTASSKLDTKKKLTKISTAGSEQSRLEYQETEPGVTGSPAKAKVLRGDVPTREKAAGEIDPGRATGKLAKAKPKKGDVPDRESGGGRVKAENRQDATYANIAVDQGEKFHAPEGFSGY